MKAPRLVGPLLVALLAIGATWNEASAHLMPARLGTIVIRDRQVYLAVTLPARLFAEADLDGDGMLSGAEATANAELLQRLAATRVHLADPTGRARLQYASVTVERMDDDTAATPRPSKYVLVLMIGAFDAPPSNLTLSVSGLDALVAADPADAKLTVRAQRGDGPGAITESASVSAGGSRMTFFRTG